MTDFTAIRYNDLDAHRYPLEFGVEWNTGAASPLLTRLGDATSLTVNSGTQPHTSLFDSYYPWSDTGRVQLTYGGQEWAKYYNEYTDQDVSDHVYDATEGQIMVKIPKFYVKWCYGDAVTKYQYWISGYPIKGYRLHPAFYRNGFVVDCVYVGAYEAYVTGSKMYSKSGVTPTGAAATGRDDFRTYATAWNELGNEAGHNWGLMDLPTYSAIQMLYIVEYASLNSQLPSGDTTRGGIGEGLMHKAKQDTGISNTLVGTTGRGSGQEQMGASGDWFIAYKGIENLWGNLYTYLDGCDTNIGTGQLYINPQNVANVDDHTGYVASSCTLPAAAGYIQTPYFINAFNEMCQFFPVDTTGADDVTYMCDYMTRDVTQIVAPVVGGAGNLGVPAYGGIFLMGGTAVDTGDDWVGARLQFIPRNHIGVNRY